jgi:hypothetical protein
VFRSLMIAQLAFVLVACPTPEERGSPLSTQPMGTSGNTPQTPADVTSTDMAPPPGAEEVPADVKQRAIGALSEKGNAIKREVIAYIKRNTAATGGLLTVTDGHQKTASVQYVRTHDPVRHRAGKGYVALTDFQDPQGSPNAFYSVAFWVNEAGEGYKVDEVVMLAYPEKQNGEWVRMELFIVNDAYAKPLR